MNCLVGVNDFGPATVKCKLVLDSHLQLACYVALGIEEAYLDHPLQM